MSEPLFSCQVMHCAAEVSYPARDLAMWQEEPICHDCYVDQCGEDDPAWHELPRFVPAHEAEIATLRARVAELEKALGAAEGYLMNALIDLQTGAPKKTAAATIEGGLKVVRAARAMEGTSDGT